MDREELLKRIHMTKDGLIALCDEEIQYWHENPYLSDVSRQLKIAHALKELLSHARGDGEKLPYPYDVLGDQRTAVTPTPPSAEGEYVVVPREPPTKKLVRAFNDWCGHNKWIEATSLDEFYRRVVAVAAAPVPGTVSDKHKNMIHESKEAEETSD